MVLTRLALSRSTLDRDADRRSRAELLTTLMADDATRVLVLREGTTPVQTAADGSVTLALFSPKQAMALADGSDQLLAYLGLVDGVAHVLLDLPGATTPAQDGDLHWATLRELGADLDESGTGLLTASVALANWHATHPRCSRCGEPTTVIASGWARQCTVCQAEHYPRTDPAVIMSIVDDAGRLLLGRQAVWPPGRYSTLAGFVEPGEPLEAAVRREVAEEAGIVVGEVTYLGSQPWPFPSSLMLAFTGRALTTDIAVDHAELEDARWVSREEVTADVASGALLLPPPLSVARRLIEHWYGTELPG